MNQPPPHPQFPGVPPPTESYANAALILGILSVVCFGPLTGIPAIICGHVARGRIARSGGALGGAGIALAGLILGYLSLLLAVVAIAVFARMFAKKAPEFQAKGAPAMVEAGQDQLQAALQQYRADFGQLPAISGNNGEQVDLKALIGVLSGTNAKGISYYKPGGNGLRVNDLPSDTWFNPLNVAIDLNGDGQVTVGEKGIPGVCAVWSSGPNKKNESGDGDDVTAW